MPTQVTFFCPNPAGAYCFKQFLNVEVLLGSFLSTNANAL